MAVALELNENLDFNMMRVIAINPFLFSISTILSSIQQALGRFVFYALAPAIYNVGILIGITVFTDGINIFGWQVPSNLVNLKKVPKQIFYYPRINVD